MKKYSVFVMALLFTLSSNLSLPTDAYAKNKVRKAASKAVKGSILGNNLNVEDSSPPAKKDAGTGNIFYDSTIGKKQAVAAPKVVATPVPVDASIGTGSLNQAEVQRNKTKEDYLAKGKVFLANSEYHKALDEFKKAKNVSSDYVVDRWVAVANNKIKADELNKKLEILNAIKKIN